MDRRTWLKLAAATAASAAFPIPAWAEANPPFQPFSLEKLDDFVRDLANTAFRAPDKRVEDALAGLPFDRYRTAITNVPERAVWRDEGLPYRFEPFHTAGAYYPYPVELFTLEGTQPVPIPYAADAFKFDPSLKMPQPAAHSGFAGFHASAQLETLGVYKEFLEFLGATNFRAISANQMFGVWARALAINTGQTGGEEFPQYRYLWIEKPKPGGQSLTVYGVFDSANAAGWIKMVVKPGYTTIIDTEAAIHPRRHIPYAGIAPIASRFFLGPGALPGKRRDYRPRVHNSEALYIVTGAGERIWRPLQNPERLEFSVFVDKTPKGFGLIQKEHYFASYQDANEQFENRPSLWIEPLSGDIWNDEGSIDLIELPAPDEKNENIICFWRPKKGLMPGLGHRFSYRMHWAWNPPEDGKQAIVTQTRVWEPKPGEPTFYVDFYVPDGCLDCGGTLDFKVMPSAGEYSNARLEEIKSIGKTHRLRFDYAPGSNGDADIRAQLVANGKTVSDTWIYRWAR